jgi:PiT family inorganic phosphate transporter
MGAGAAKRLSAVRWGVAGNIALAWLLTLPCSAVIGGVAYGLSQIVGDDAIGVILVALLVIGLIAAAFATRVRRGPAITTAAPAPAPAES